MAELKPDYYRVLGVARTVSKAALKKAFHALARKYHPDVCDQPDAEARFKAINEAYQVLSNDHLRAQYDHLNPPRWQRGRVAYRDYSAVDSFFEGYTPRSDQYTYEPREHVCYFHCPYCGDETYVFFSDTVIGWDNYIRQCEVCARPVSIEYRVEKNKVVMFEARACR